MRNLRTVLVVAVLALGALPAQAELVVVGESGTSYKVDQRLGDDAKLEVPKGGSVTLKRLPDGNTVVVDGPYSGALSGYAPKSGCPWWNPFCKNDNGTGTGGTRGLSPGDEGGEEQESGGTRGL